MGGSTFSLTIHGPLRQRACTARFDFGIRCQVEDVVGLKIQRL